MTAYKPDSRGRCPHCLTVVRFEERRWYRPRFTFRGAVCNMGKVFVRSVEGIDEDVLLFTAVSCPECKKLTLTVEAGKQIKDFQEFVPEEEFVVWPRQRARPPIPDGIPPHIAADYKEAASVLNLSPKASAALSRRCLQALLREVENANQRSLSKQIDAVIPNLPSYIAESIDAIRNIGNFAAHPIKDQNSGQVVDVEPGEAEWNLDVLDMLFDFYYVQPALAKQKRDTLDAKLAAASKPPMK